MKQIDLEPDEAKDHLNLLGIRLVEIREQLWAQQKALWVVIFLLAAIALRLWFF